MLQTAAGLPSGGHRLIAKNKAFSLALPNGITPEVSVPSSASVFRCFTPSDKSAMEIDAASMDEINDSGRSAFKAAQIRHDGRKQFRYWTLSPVFKKTLSNGVTLYFYYWSFDRDPRESELLGYFVFGASFYRVQATLWNYPKSLKDVLIVLGSIRAAS